MPFTDNHPDAVGGFAEATQDYALKVIFPEHLLNLLPPEQHCALLEVLEQDPRPSYQQDAARIYGFIFAHWEIRFRVQEKILTVVEVKPI